MPSFTASHAPSGRRDHRTGWAPKSNAASSVICTWARPRTPTTRRKITVRVGEVGRASASRHSTMASSVIQRRRQISVPGSYHPPRTWRETGVTA